ncbi:DoxX family protein [Puniceicoccus vermicola]|uniref:DoxX family protein n=1 Tax=Puniceicoccus vermicola TaxID=388746 RepID=A0A7X1AXD8_9BACT|nr:DoxX family protein [Puniceicoccus vermicola]MBC2601509.1 DoxX family protein [Puniceicoccus vermicola]
MNIKSTILSTRNTLAFIPLRLGVGAVMFAHGSQKLFGMFGGYGLRGTGNFFAEQLGLQPGILMAALAGGTEFIGGILLIIGFATRIAGLALVGTMAVAIATAHAGAFFLPEGMEYALTLLLASLTLAIGGAGSLSVDRILTAKKV